MRVLLIGSGGREHALAWAIKRSPRCDALYAAPGNPGIAALADDCRAVPVSDIAGLVALAQELAVGLVVVGPEAPLVDGLADALAEVKIPCFGPGAAGARLEGSKQFSKDLMRKLRIPTARYEVYTDPVEARAALSARKFPAVVKADGLAAGKGVIICRDFDEAAAAVEECMVASKFGGAGATIVVEDFLVGRECSMIAITDGEALLFFPASRDHKRIGDGDTGPNTGGMGAFSPVPDLSDAQREQIEREVFIPLLHGLKKEGIAFRGCLYAGLMLTKGGPRVLEWNVRFGDPETQVIVPRYEGDLLVALHAAATGTLGRVQQAGFGRPAVAVVCAAAGYPESARKGDVITGIDAAEADDDIVVFQAGTKAQDGGLVTNGGRVLAVTARGDTLPDAKAKAYEGVAKIEWSGKTIRTDIGSSI